MMAALIVSTTSLNQGNFSITLIFRLPPHKYPYCGTHIVTQTPCHIHYHVDTLERPTRAYTNKGGWLQNLVPSA